ncbi:zinc-binding dehydrogenase [Paenibacillus mucilaginosus]|uniref:zinc-binding dehydrogenase n=1 Tax=Paenibacillus mucilaginosus TaxID=61624 RepID=UPI0009D919C7|nr:zinc-binding dehydrogenase [Paenibacillus mucilaginosus]
MFCNSTQFGLRLLSAQLLLDTLKPGGRLIPITWGSNSSDKAAKATITVQEVQYLPFASAYRIRLVNGGQLNVTIDSMFPLEETAKAHKKSESRRARGKNRHSRAIKGLHHDSRLK